MALRLAGLLAARASRSSSSVTNRATADAPGSKRHLTLSLLVGHIDAGDVSRVNATPSQDAFNVLIEAERKLQRSRGDPPGVAQFRDRIFELPQSESCQILGRGLDSLYPAHRRAWLRACRELVEERVLKIDSILDAYIVPQVAHLLRGARFPDVQLEAALLLAAIAQGGRPDAVLDSRAVGELYHLATSAESRGLRDAAGEAIGSVWNNMARYRVIDGKLP